MKRPLVALVLLTLLAACDGGGDPVKRIDPKSLEVAEASGVGSTERRRRAFQRLLGRHDKPPVTPPTDAS